MKTTLLHPGMWAALLLPVVTLPATAQTLPAAAGDPPADKSAAADNADPLAFAKANLGQAADAMQGATADNKGGYVQRARDDLARATDIMNEWHAYLHVRPEVKLLPPTFSYATDALGSRIGIASTATGINSHPKLRSALKALRATVADLQGTPGGDTGGYRSRLVASLDQATTDVIAGMNFAMTNPGSAAHTMTPMGPPANANNFNAPALNVTQRLELARRAPEQTEDALHLPPTGGADELAESAAGCSRALASCSLALADVAAAMSYIKENPTISDLTGGAMSPEDPPVRLADLPPALDRNPAGRFTNPPLVAAIDALNSVLNALTNARPTSDPVLPNSIEPDLGGTRLKLMRDISQTEADINAGLNETYDAYVAARHRVGPGAGN